MNREDYLTGITLYKGNSSEAVVLTAYVQAGFLVSLPFGGGAAYDLIVDTGMRLLKVQVKTGKLSGGCVIYNSRRHRGSKYNTFSRYREGEVDIFSIWCPDSQQLYAVSAGQSLNIEGRLRTVATQNFQRKKNQVGSRLLLGQTHRLLEGREVVAQRTILIGARSSVDKRAPIDDGQTPFKE